MASAAYHAADAFSPHLDIAQRGRQYFFATPQTPVTTARSSSHYNSALSTSTTDRSYFSSQTPNPSNISRKRPRYDRSEYSVAHSRATPSIDADSMSPMPLVNTDYRLAGGLDTPTAAATSRLSLYNDSTPDISLRRGRSFTSGNERTGYFPDYNEEDMATLPGKDGNGRAPAGLAAASTTTTGSTWGGIVFDLAGKIWGLCTNSFQGFYAGGGQGYSLNNSKTQVGSAMARPPPSSRMESGTWIDVSRDTRGDQDSDSDKRRSKKSKMAHTPDIRESWVMVGSPGRERTREASPSLSYRSPPTTVTPGIGTPSITGTRRLHTLKSRPSLNLRRTSTATASSSRPASSAGLRSAKPISPPTHLSKRRRSSSYNSPTCVITKEIGHQRRQSNIGRPMTPSSAGAMDTGAEGESPIARQTADYMERQRKRQVKEDGKFRKMNARLEDMIRQGREALGTRVEVEQWSDGDEEEVELEMDMDMEGEGCGEDMPGGW